MKSIELTTLIMYFAIVGAVLSAIFYALKWHKTLWMTFLQNFCGVWFIFSGFVKAVDPIGTKYKLEQYFAEFDTTFAGCALKGLAPMFPFLSKYALPVGIFTIILEIVLGVLLIFGVRRKLTAWLFFLLMLFFTALTGFTYLTGYVPQGTNFFDFAKWGPYVKTNMRVTDCGCFGDFIILDPKISFFKDLFLMIPAFLFVFFTSKMHKLFNRKARFFATALVSLATLFFCFQNTYWDLPIVDFRPFKIGTDLPARKKLENEAEAKVKIIGYIMENEKTGEKKRLDIPDTTTAAKFYMDVIYKGYPKEAGWKVADQVKTEPEVKHTKVSEFMVYDVTENESEVTDDILSDPNYSFMIISNKLEHDKVTEKSIMVYDSIQVIDTVRIGKKINLVKKDSVLAKEVPVVTVEWNREFLATFKDKIGNFANAALKNGNKVAVITHDQPIVIREFAKTLEAKYTFYQADDILLKTITRSNPGVVLLKNGVVINMWHINKLPTFEEVKAKDFK
jgi:uncharacterized membrane protein YphA (DoxX/SURF4 family)